MIRIASLGRSMYQSQAPDLHRFSRCMAGIVRRTTASGRHWRQALEWTGCTFGLIGAGLLAMNSAESGYGFVAFLLSNLCWIAFALASRLRGLLLMQVGFLATSMLGLWRWLL